MSTETTSDDSSNVTQIPDSVKTDLRRAGASKLFIKVIETQAKEVGVERNSARCEILKYMEWSEESDKEVTDYLNYGGSFFQSLFEGNPMGADMNNQQILDYIRNSEPRQRVGVQRL